MQPEPAHDDARPHADLQRLRDDLARLQRRVAEAAGGLTDSAADLAAASRDRARTLAGQIEAAARENPLGALAGSVVAGFLLGALLRGRDR